MASRLTTPALGSTSRSLHATTHRPERPTGHHRVILTSALPKPETNEPSTSQPNPYLSQPLRASLAALAACSLVAASPVMVPHSAIAATDNAKVGTCVLSKCQNALANCLGDVKCVENLVCLQTCTTAPDETACQIKCGDLYADKAVDVFNTCAVSEQKCVPQKVDEGLFPIPTDCALDKNFDLTAFQGRWYITAGLNPLFDSFPCQEHFFATPPGKEGVVYAEINWRVPLGQEGDFIQRSTMQRFVQQPENPAILFNHDNEYLHYQDDWYIIGSKPDEYVFVYYRGQNDAWKGYGGATVYTRQKSLPVELIPELQAQAEAAGLDWSQFQLTDNTCPPKAPPKGPLEELQEDLAVAERFVETGVEPRLQSFGRGFTGLEREIEEVAEEVVREVEDEEAVIAAELKREAQAAQRLVKRFRMEAEMDIPIWLQKLPLPIRELIMPMPMKY